MAAFKYSLKIDQGSDFAASVTWGTGTPASGSTPAVLTAPYNLTGCTAQAMVRQNINSATVLATLSTSNNEIVLGGAAGTIAFAIPAATSAAWTWQQGVYDLLITFPSGAITRILYGTITVNPGVTHA